MREIRSTRGLAVLLVVVIAAAATPAWAAISWVNFGTGTAAFETPTNWSTTTPGETTPPGVYPDPGAATAPYDGTGGTFFIEGNSTQGNFRGTITWTEPRDGRDANHPKIGSLSLGGGISDEVTTLIISTDVVFTGVEHNNTTGEYSGTRNVRVGQSDFVSDDTFPWGIVKQTTGTVTADVRNPDGTPNNRGDIDLSDDKAVSAGGIWEVGGNASLMLIDPGSGSTNGSDIQMGDKAGTKSPGSIFRVRGSDVGQVHIGDTFRVTAQSSSWDVSEVDLGAGYRDQLNRGKNIVEFVLDTDGVTPIEIGDELRLGGNAAVNTPNLGIHNAYLLAFLRVKLSEPTTKGSGAYNSADPGAGDVITLFKSDRIISNLTVLSGTELDEGRFFDPDRISDSGTAPHRSLLDGQILKADYAGATYNWNIHYFESAPGADSIVTPSVILSDLFITGTQGDLNGDTMVSEADRTDLQNAIAAPPVIAINGPQHLYDLNADGAVDNLDLTTFNTFFLPPTGLPGDFNDDGLVDARDYTVWRDNLGAADEATVLNGNGDGLNGVDNGDYTLWKNNYGAPGSGGLAAGAVPEPGTLLLVVCGAIGLVGVRRRAA